MYTGPYRSGERRLILKATCTEVHLLEIIESPPWNDRVFLDGVSGQRLDSRGCKDLALQDGFLDWMTLYRWIERQYGLPFEGLVIRWRENNDADE